MRKLKKGDKPAILDENETKWNQDYVDWKREGGPIPSGGRDSSGRYGHISVKSALRNEAFGKCVYCEALITGATYEPIDHILPKSQKECWHLFCDWDNLALSCNICNTNKGTYYDPNLPLLNPFIDFPDEHLRYEIVTAVGLSKRGRKTICKLKMNEAERLSYRGNFIGDVEEIIDDYKDTQSDAAKGALARSLRAKILDNKPVSLVLECYIRCELPEIFEN